MPRAEFKPQPKVSAGGVQFLPSGGTILDLILGGGYARGRITNIVGDRSSGKTLLAIEAAANHAVSKPAESVRYAEAEAAFDREYAESMGLPPGVDLSEEGEITTVEDFGEDLVKFIKRYDGALYIMDSLDSLSSKAEQARELGEDSYATEKPKILGEMFRRDVSLIRDRNATLLIISQLRDKIGVTFGETKTRSGGRALDYYASQIVWLSEIEKIKRTVLGVDRYVGVKVRAANKKNKVGKPFRRGDFTILFGYGVDDEVSLLDWLVSNKAAQLLDKEHDAYRKELAEMRAAKDRAALRELNKYLKEIVTDRWNRIEDKLEPDIGKYE